MKLKVINKILIPIYVYCIICLLYFLLTHYVFESFILTKYYDYLYELIYFVLPFFVIFDFVRRKRKLDIRSFLLTFFVSLLPGFLTGLIFGYGWFGMGHGGDFSKFISVSYLFILAFSFASGLVGFLIDVIWETFRKLD